MSEIAGGIQSIVESISEIKNDAQNLSSLSNEYRSSDG